MSDRVPRHVILEWIKQCSCCLECTGQPCDGVRAGGLCDKLCRCDEREERPDDEDCDVDL